MIYVSCTEAKVDPAGFEPAAFRMQSECDTTTPLTLDTCLLPLSLLIPYPNYFPLAVIALSESLLRPFYLHSF